VEALGHEHRADMQVMHGLVSEQSATREKKEGE
jgi:hypothetical protein